MAATTTAPTRDLASTQCTRCGHHVAVVIPQDPERELFHRLCGGRLAAFADDEIPAIVDVDQVEPRYGQVSITVGAEQFHIVYGDHDTHVYGLVRAAGAWVRRVWLYDDPSVIYYRFTPEAT